MSEELCLPEDWQNAADMIRAAGYVHPADVIEEMAKVIKTLSTRVEEMEMSAELEYFEWKESAGSVPAMSDIVEQARVFATKAHAEIGQLRKYDGLPYITHPAAVVEIVRSVPHDDNMLAAA